MEERRQTILYEVNTRGKVRVSELSRELGVSEVTIRGDIKAMDKEGLLKRTHGGAISLLPQEKQQHETDGHKYNADSLYRHVERKKKIAAAAYEFIEDRDTIIIDDASSTFYLALYIREHPEKRLTVVTNSIPAANELARLSHIELFMIGGLVGGHLAATMGETAVEMMRQVHVDKAFIGVHSINFDVGLTSIGTPQMQVKQAIRSVADRVYVLADSSKFGSGYLSVVCPMQEVYKIITDDEVSQENIRKAEELAVPLVIAREMWENTTKNSCLI